MISRKAARNARMKEMAEDGYTYAEIGRTFGISKQRVHQICGSPDKQKFRIFDKGRCIFPALREYLNRAKCSVSCLCMARYGRIAPESEIRMSNILRGSAEPRKKDIDFLISFTGIPYEMLFEKDGEE